MTKNDLTNLVEIIAEQLFIKNDIDIFFSEMAELYIELDDELSIDKLINDITIEKSVKASVIKSELEEFTKAHSKINLFIEEVIKRDFVEMLSSNNMKYFETMLKEQIRSRIKVNLTLAVSIENNFIIEIAHKIKEKLRKNIIINIKYKSNIIGGYIIEYEGNIIDASVEKLLEEYRRDWVKTLSI